MVGRSAWSWVVVGVLGLSVPALASRSEAPGGRPCEGDRSVRRERHEQRRAEHRARLNEAVRQGRVSQQDVAAFDAKAAALKGQVQQLRASQGGKLSPEQRAQFKGQRRALVAELRGKMKPVGG